VIGYKCRRCRLVWIEEPDPLAVPDGSCPRCRMRDAEQIEVQFPVASQAPYPATTTTTSHLATFTVPAKR
jgi:hypothetical protein